MPPYSSITHAASSRSAAQRARARRAGSRPSRRCRSRSPTIALYPRSRADVMPRSKWTPSTSASVVRTSSPPPGARTAASSPGRRRPRGRRPTARADRGGQLVFAQLHALRSGQPARPARVRMRPNGRPGGSLDSRPHPATGLASVRGHRTRRSTRARGLRQPLAGGAPVLHRGDAAVPHHRVRQRERPDRVLSRSAASTYVVDRDPHSGKTMTREEYDAHREAAGRVPRAARHDRDRRLHRQRPGAPHAPPD